VSVTGHGLLADQLMRIRVIDRSGVRQLAGSQRGYRDVRLDARERLRHRDRRLCIVDHLMAMRLHRLLREQGTLDHGLRDLGERLLQERHIRVSQHGSSAEQRRRCVHHVAAVGLDDLLGDELAQDGRENGSTLHGDDARQHGNHHLRKRRDSAGVKAFGCCREEQNADVNDDIVYRDEIVSESGCFVPTCSE